MVEILPVYSVFLQPLTTGIEVGGGGVDNAKCNKQRKM